MEEDGTVIPIPVNPTDDNRFPFNPGDGGPFAPGNDNDEGGGEDDDDDTSIGLPIGGQKPSIGGGLDNEEEFVSPATIPPEIDNGDIGLPPTGIGVIKPGSEETGDNPASDLIGGIGLPPPSIDGGPGGLPDFPGFPGRPPIGPTTKPPFEPDTNTERPNDFDGVGPLLTTTTEYPDDHPTTLSPIDNGEADVVIIDQFAEQNVTILETRAFDMISYLSTLETRIVFNRLNTGACQLHCTVITKTNKLFVDQTGNQIDVRS